MWGLEHEQRHAISKIRCRQARDRVAALVERVWAWVDEHCWSERWSAYVLHPGIEDLDAGVLPGARFGVDRGERMHRTTTAVLDRLSAAAWLYRRTVMAQEEGASVACAFRAVEALGFTDRRSQAVGDLPQALGHQALVNASCALSETGAWNAGGRA